MMSDRGVPPDEKRDQVRSYSGMTRICGLAAFLYAALFSFTPVANYDIWWHLATGRWIAAHRSVPVRDVLSFATAGAPWQPHYWLSDLLLYGVERMSGTGGLIAVKTLIIAAAFFLAYRLALRLDVPGPTALFGIILAVPVARFRFLVRPHIFMFLFTAITLHLLFGPKKRRAWLVPLMLVWANAHASFLLGLGLIGARVIGEALPPSREPGKAKHLTLLLALCGGVTLINPSGIHLLHWVVSDFFSKSVTHSFAIEENARLVWGAHPGYWAWLIAGTIVMVLSLLRRPRWERLLIFAATALLALSGIRFISVALICQVPIVLAAAVELIPGRIGAMAGSRVMVVGAGVLAPILLFVTFGPEKAYRMGGGVSPGYLPSGVSNRLEEWGLEVPLYNSWELGGGLAWLRDDTVFIDGRCLPSQLRLYERLMSSGAADVETTFRDTGVQGGVVSYRDQAMLHHFSGPGYTLLYMDDDAALFLRESTAVERGLSGAAFRLLVPRFHDLSYLKRIAQGPERRDLGREIERALALAPASARIRMAASAFYEGAGDIAAALDHAEAALTLRPRMSVIHYGIGRRAGTLALMLGEWNRAVRNLQIALRFSSSDQARFLMATALYKSGRLREAAKIYERILKGNPRQEATLINLGFVRFDQDRFDEAARLHAKALTIAPKRSDALYGYALALTRAGRIDQAREAWDRFLREHPRDPLAPLARKERSALRIREDSAP